MAAPARFSMIEGLGSRSNTLLSMRDSTSPSGHRAKPMMKLIGLVGIAGVDEGAAPAKKPSDATEAVVYASLLRNGRARAAAGSRQIDPYRALRVRMCLTP